MCNYPDFCNCEDCQRMRLRDWFDSEPEQTAGLIGSECDIADELIVICEEQVVVDRHNARNNWTCSDPNCPCQGWEMVCDDERYYSRSDEQADLANAEYYDELAKGV